MTIYFLSSEFNGFFPCSIYGIFMLKISSIHIIYKYTDCPKVYPACTWVMHKLRKKIIIATLAVSIYILIYD